MEGWLKCRVVNGMFSDEFTVVIRRRGNGSVEFFVPNDQVKRGTGECGSVRVKVFRRHDGPWVELPTPYGDSVPVEEAELQTA